MHDTPKTSVSADLTARAREIAAGLTPAQRAAVLRGEPVRVYGRDAIDLAANGLRIDKHADPTEGAREGLTVGEAKGVCHYDPSLVYVTLGDDLGRAVAAVLTGEAVSR